MWASEVKYDKARGQGCNQLIWRLVSSNWFPVDPRVYNRCAQCDIMHLLKAVDEIKVINKNNHTSRDDLIRGSC